MSDEWFARNVPMIIPMPLLTSGEKLGPCEIFGIARLGWNWRGVEGAQLALESLRTQLPSNELQSEFPPNLLALVRRRLRVIWCPISAENLRGTKNDN